MNLRPKLHLMTAWYGRYFYLNDLKFFLSRNVLYVVFLVLSVACWPVAKRLSLVLLMMSSRARSVWLSRALIRRRLPEVLNCFYADATKDGLSEQQIGGLTSRIVVIRHYKQTLSDAPIDKGILIIKFSETLDFCMRTGCITRLAPFYFIVIEPSWAGYALPQILALTSYQQHNFYVECADSEDYELLQFLDTNLIPVRIGSGNWVDFERFKPLPDTRQVHDLLLVANNNPIKRVLSFIQIFDRNPNLTGLLVCAGHGTERERIQKLLQLFSLSNLAFSDGVSPDDLNKIINQSKYVCLMSLKEGSNRSLFESMAAGTHAILIDRNIGVDRSFFDGKAGSIVSQRDIAIKVREVPPNRHEIREWAEGHISPTQSVHHLVNTINETEGTLLNVDSVRGKVNAPEIAYAFEDSEFNLQLNREILTKHLSK
ncbi:MAG: glycosyltransferase [Pseudomonadota bacterium]